MLSLYRQALQLRHSLMPSDHTLEWLPQDRSSERPDGADGNTGGVIAYKRPGGWMVLTNFGEEPIELPAGTVLLTSGELTADGKLPQDTTVWMQE